MTERDSHDDGRSGASVDIEGDIDSIAGSYHDGDEKEYYSQQWDAQDGDAGDSGGGDSDGGNGCYIATVTIGRHREDSLSRLRAWRTGVLRQSALGQRLESWYDVTGPVVAEFVRHHPTFGLTFLPFVMPADFALCLLPVGLLQNAVVYTCFVLGLAYGTAVYWLVR